MNTNRWFVAILGFAVLVCPAVYSAADSGLKGRWATDAGQYLDNRETSDISRSTFWSTAYGDGGFGGGENIQPQSVEPRGRGMRGAGRKGPFKGGRGRGTIAGRRNFQASSRNVNTPVSPNSNPFANGAVGNNGLTNGLALILELKMDKKNNLTGSMTVYTYDGARVRKQKAKIEAGRVVDDTFSFTTNHKFGEVLVPNAWQGELTSGSTIRMTRRRPAGERLELELLTFRRT